MFRICEKYNLSESAFWAKPESEQIRLLARERYIRDRLNDLRENLITTRGAYEAAKKSKSNSDKMLTDSTAYYLLAAMTI